MPYYHELLINGCIISYLIMAENKEKLFDMFPPVSTDEWMAKINVDLKGADFNKKLVWRTNERLQCHAFLS